MFRNSRQYYRQNLKGGFINHNEEADPERLQQLFQGARKDAEFILTKVCYAKDDSLPAWWQHRRCSGLDPLFKHFFEPSWCAVRQRCTGREQIGCKSLKQQPHLQKAGLEPLLITLTQGDTPGSLQRIQHAYAAAQCAACHQWASSSFLH